MAAKKKKKRQVHVISFTKEVKVKVGHVSISPDRVIDVNVIKAGYICRREFVSGDFFVETFVTSPKKGFLTRKNICVIVKEPSDGGFWGSYYICTAMGLAPCAERFIQIAKHLWEENYPETILLVLKTTVSHGFFGPMPSPYAYVAGVTMVAESVMYNIGFEYTIWLIDEAKLKKIEKALEKYKWLDKGVLATGRHIFVYKAGSIPKIRRALEEYEKEKGGEKKKDGGGLWD